MFTTSEQIAIQKWLGYPIAPGYSTMIQQACVQISNMGEAYEAEVKKTLRELADVQKDIDDSRLGAGRSFQSSGTGTAQFFRGERLNELKQSGRQHIRFLSQLMNLSVYQDVFSGRSSGGSSGHVVRG